jgi:hypothetical protein
MIDALFQTGGLFEFLTSQTLVLPYKIGRMTVHHRVVTDRLYFGLTRKTATEKDTFTYQIDLVDPNGALYIRIRDFQMVKLGLLEEEYRIINRLIPS